MRIYLNYLRENEDSLGNINKNNFEIILAIREFNRCFFPSPNRAQYTI